ncbi:MAG: YigZ family protein [Firmicutes bacterium]|nr:YigZ family protein [Bacillota bacterium]
MLLEYRTVARAAQAEIVVKRSRFICAVWPVQDREEAEARIAEWSQLHARATHNVPAFRVGLGYLVEGCSDDGEPAGTAGRPALSVLQKEDLRQVALVVTRYFGGTLLGAAGLVRAYTDAVVAGLAAAGVVTMRHHTALEIQSPYDLFGKLQHYIATAGHPTDPPEYGAEVRWRVWVPTPAVDRTVKDLTELSAGRLILRVGEGAYRPVEGKP